MPKMKVVSSVSKRFKPIASGNVKRRHANLRHILTKKSKKRKRNLRSNTLVSNRDIRLVTRCLPY